MEEETLYHFKIFILRAIGLRLQEIGKELGKNSSTILHHLRKRGYTHRFCGKCAENLQYYSEFIITQLPPPIPLLPPRFCQSCEKVLTKTQARFCSYKCSNSSQRRKRWWPKWIENEKGERISTGKTYKEYINETN